MEERFSKINWRPAPWNKETPLLFKTLLLHPPSFSLSPSLPRSAHSVIFRESLDFIQFHSVQSWFVKCRFLCDFIGIYILWDPFPGKEIHKVEKASPDRWCWHSVARHGVSSGPDGFARKAHQEHGNGVVWSVSWEETQRIPAPQPLLYDGWEKWSAKKGECNLFIESIAYGPCCMLGTFLEDWLYNYPLGRLLQLHFTDEKIKAEVPWDLYSFLTYLLILSTHVSLGLLMLPNAAHVLMEWNPPSPGDYGVEMISKWLCSQKKKKKKRFWMVTFSSFPDWIPSLIKPKRRACLKGALFDCIGKTSGIPCCGMLVTKTGKELF